MCKYRLIMVVAAAMLAFTSDVSAQVQCVKPQQITIPNTSYAYGALVSVSGDTAVAALRFSRSDRAADVFRLNGTVWMQEQQLTFSDEPRYGYRTDAISISDGAVAVSVNGYVYVFRFDGEKWVEEQQLTASAATQYDGFGASVAISGDTVVVGARADDCNGVESSSCGSVYVYHFDGIRWIEQQKLVASDAVTQDYFGGAVSIDGDTVIVGSLHLDFVLGNNYGSAYIFQYDGTSWIEQQKLTSSNPMSTDYFGASVSVSGGTAVVGASFDACAAGDRCGSAYVFHYDGFSWGHGQKLRASDVDRYNFFGESVSVSGDKVVVGSRNANCAFGHDCGAAYLFRYAGGSWVEQLRLTASDPRSSDQFGASVAIDGDTVVVGGRSTECTIESRCISLQMFTLMPGEMCESCDVTGGLDDVEKDCNGNGQADSCDISNGVSNDCNEDGVPDECGIISHGHVLLNDFDENNLNVSSMFGDTLAVGASEDDGKEAHSGAVYIVQSEQNAWKLDHKLMADDGSTGDRFGAAIAVSSYCVIIGAPGDDATGPSSGSVYYFEREYDGTGWSEKAKITLPPGEVAESFGSVVALAGNLAAITAYTPNVAPYSAVYVYGYDGSTWNFKTKLANAADSLFPALGHTLAINNHNIVAGALDRKGSRGGAVYVFRYDYSQGNWVEYTILRLNDSDVHHGGFGNSLALGSDLLVVGNPTFHRTGLLRTSAHVYRLHYNKWELQANLYAKDSTEAILMGRSVAFDGTRILLGAQVGPGDNPPGGVLVYHLQGDKWAQEQVITSTSENPSFSFGSHVAISGKTAFVGSSVISQGQKSAAILSFGLGGPDCNQNGVLDSCDITAGTSEDCDANGFLDECEVDCNENGVSDTCDILDGTESDCNENGVPDSCDLEEEVEKDCNGNAKPDICDIINGESADCNDNGVPDECEAIARGQFELDSNPRSLSMHEGVVATCSRGVDENGISRNAAYVFQSTDTEWGLDQILFAPDGITSDRFCESIATHGNRIIVGAPGTHASDLSDGSVYVFEKDGRGWSQRAKLTLPEGDVGEDFGYAVALSGSRAFVSAVNYYKAPYYAVYAYRLVGETWEFESKLISPDEKNYLSFGQSLSASGDTLVVGAPGSRGGGEGAVYVYKRIERQWIQQAEFIGGDINHGRFGNSVFIEGDVMVAGDPTNAALRIGNAGHVYRLQNGEWVLEAVLKASRSSGINRLGRSIAMDGDRILLKGVVWSGPKSGAAVVVFHRWGDQWIEEQILFAPVGGTVAYFIDAIGISGQTAFIGGSVGSQGQAHGVLYSYGLSGPDCNENGVLDSCDVTDGTSQDCTSNGFLDECEDDCNDNGVADSCDIEDGVEQDCNGNRVPDECDIVQHESRDCNDNDVPDECEADGDHDGVPDDCDQCPDSDTSGTVVVNSCDTGVNNVILKDGCSMTDRLSECRDKASQRGSFVSCVSKFTRRWRKYSLLSKKEAARIVRCAAQNNKSERRRNMPGRR